MNKFCQLLLIGFGLVCSSCQRTPVLPELESLNEAIISGMQPVYRLQPDETLTIRPDVSFSQDSLATDSARYLYEWIFIFAPPVGSGFPYVTIGTEKDLVDFSMDYISYNSQGFFDFTFRVIDTYTDTFSEFAFRVIVANDFFEGWVVLNDVSGQTRVDMLSYQAHADTFLQLRDILAANSSISGKPNFVDFSFSMHDHLSLGSIVVGTESGIEVFTNDSLAFAFDLYGHHPPLNEIPSEQKKSARYYGMLYNHYLHLGRTIYQKSEQLGASPDYFPISSRETANGAILPFQASPFLAIDLGRLVAWNIVVMFDEEALQFLWHSEALAAASPLPHVQLPNPDDDWRLAYMAYTRNGGGQYLAVLKNDSNNTASIVRFTLYELLDFLTLEPDSRLAHADHIVLDPNTGDLYFASDQMLYVYAGGDHKLQEFDKEITMLKFNEFLLTQEFSVGSSVNKARYNTYEQHLLIATHDPDQPDDSGELHLYEPSQRRIDTSYTGFARIIDVTYKER